MKATAHIHQWRVPAGWMLRTRGTLRGLAPAAVYFSPKGSVLPRQYLLAERTSKVPVLR